MNFMTSEKNSKPAGVYSEFLFFSELLFYVFVFFKLLSISLSKILFKYSILIGHIYWVTRIILLCLCMHYIFRHFYGTSNEGPPCLERCLKVETIFRFHFLFEFCWFWYSFYILVLYLIWDFCFSCRCTFLIF